MGIEEKVKIVILEEIKNLADEAWNKPTDDNICKMFNAVEYLKKVLKKDNYTSLWNPSRWIIWPWNPSQLILRKEDMLTCDIRRDGNKIMVTSETKD